MAVLRTALLRASRSPSLRRLVSGRPFVGRAVRRFMPGETMTDALAAAHRQQADGLGTVLTLLGEDLPDAGAAAAVAGQYRALLGAFAGEGLDAEISVKPTQLGLDASPGLAARAIGELADLAAPHGRTVWIDMEGTAHTDATLELFRALRAERANVGVCLQANLRRTASDLDALLPLEPSIRLVKGAYLEPAALAFTRKAEVDRSFAALAERLLAAQADRAADREAAGGEAGVLPPRLALATHDEAMIAAAREAARRSGATGYEFHLLYGIRPGLQRQLAADGERVRCLISYGPDWFPWYMRRLAERPANLVFALRSMLPG